MRMIRDLVASCIGLPMPLRIGLLVVAGGGSIYMIMYFLSTLLGRATWILLVGVIAVVLLLTVFGLLVKWMKKRKAAPMERDIVGQAAGAPTGVSAASRRAALDDLRRNFETGIGTFRAAGKNLYSLPWYVIVGEPGSGKTEALRHSNIGFPPGLHDPLQGAGGTINMNWWFTDKAVILDTAGRLMFEEVPAGTTSEWQEFLKLLRTYRYNCPINGLLLVIPADTLITDTADQIKSKANKIAEQLHQIQRVLEVRFPVFVSITKCDLINGFREFFDNVTDPDLQQQIMGWSNPSPLDEEFKPEQVSQHLETVCERLRRRRLGLMLDPVHTDDPSGHRINQVDALYALPQSLARIAPRLRHYLDHVFAGGVWTGKPLFLRGIYFTSSMREGSVLDEELAEALGVPVKSIQEGREWERERSYFLRDLFLDKIFKEKGLVTRAIHAGRQRSARKAIVLAAGFISALVLAAFTWFGVRALRESIGLHRDYWVAAAKETNWRRAEGDRGPVYWRPIVALDHIGSTDYVYAGKTLVEVGNDEVRLGQFHQKLAELVAKPIHIPWIFWLAQIGRIDIGESQADAQHLIFERGVLRPLADAARVKMMLDDGGRWPSELSPALAGLIRLESPSGDLPDLDPVARCSLYREPPKDAPAAAAEPAEADEPSKKADEPAKAAKESQIYIENYNEYLKDKEPLALAMARAYTDGAGLTPQKGADAGTRVARLAIDKGVDRFIKHWVREGKLAARQLEKIISLKELLLKDYKDKEKVLLDVDEEFAPRLKLSTEKKADVVQTALDEWTKRIEDLYRVRTPMETRLADFPDGPVYPVFQRTSAASVQEVREAFDKFRVEATIAPPRAVGQPAEQPAGGPGLPDLGKVSKKAGDVQKGAEKVKGALDALKGKTGDGLDAERWKALAESVNGSLDAALKELESSIVPQTMADEVRQVDIEFLNPLEFDKALWDRLAEHGLVKAKNGRTLRLYELRLLMYRLGDAERGKDDAVGERGSFKEVIKAVEDAVNVACSQITELRDLPVLKDMKPSPPFRVPEAAAVSTFTAQELALPQRVYKTLQDVLAKAPKAEEEVAAKVQEAAAGLPVVAKPKIVLTAMQGGSFDAKFHPQAVTAILRRCKEAGDVLADEKLNVLNREKLQMMWQHWNGACGRFVGGAYVNYWGRTVPTDLESHGQDWPSFRKAVEGADIFEVFISLGDVGKAITTALSSDLEPSLTGDAKQQFTLARENTLTQIRKLTNNIYQSKCREVRGNWTKLGDDPFEARSRLAAQERGDIIEKYLPFAYKVPDEFGDKYWTDLTYEALRLIIKGAAESGTRIFDELGRNYGRFPLVQPVERTKPLEPADVNAARLLVDKLVLQWKDAPPARAAEPERSERGRTAVDKMLDELVVLRFTPPQWDWIKKIKAVMDGLPTGDKALKCEIWVPAAQPNPAAGLRWGHIRIKQGDKEIGKGNTSPGADYKLCDVWYPGDKLEIRLYRYPVDPAPNRGVDVDGPWAAVRLLHPGVQESDPLYAREHFKHYWQAEKAVEKNELLDTTKRTVLLTIEDDQKQPRLLRLRLQFEKGLPRIEDWPVSAAR